MYEVEVKVRADHDRLRGRLGEIDAEHVETVDQVDTYYDAPHRDFAATDEAFRVRAESKDSETETKITYKGPRVEAESKTREEFETHVGDGETMRAIAESLGFEPAVTVRKERERFEASGFTVTLDSVEGLGEFLEVETEVAAEADVETARERAFELLEDLDLEPDEQIRTSYLGLLLANDAQR
ncbi:MAG: class IV adenylate cyclase [Halapricum sp.]